MEREPLIYKDRRGTDCQKWDDIGTRFSRADLDAFWVADMDFEAPAGVTAAVRAWADHGIYGYYRTPESYYSSFIAWELERHHFDVRQEWLRYSPGAIIHGLLQVMTEPGDGIALLTPAYYPFFDAIRNTDRKAETCPLINENGVYSIDFDALDRTLASAKVMVFCTPHNPIGRVWTPDEISQIAALCKKHNVYIISDEIHQDLILGDKPHYPTATVTDAPTVTLASASKTFNIAGLSNAFVIIPDPVLREKYDKYQSRTGVSRGASVGYVAARAAFETGGPWLSSLIDQVRSNERLFRSMLAEKLPNVIISPLEGTYLLWIDLRAYVSPEDMHEVMEQKCRLAIDYGEWFGFDDYRCFMRFNLATSTENVRLAANRLIAALSE